MLGEVSGKDRLEALQTHRAYLKQHLAKYESNPPAASELEATEALISRMYGISQDPRGHWVEVTKSRVVCEGSVGKVVYASAERGHCRVEFGTGERVSCGFGNVTVIDWEPLPAFIPWVGERIRNSMTGEELIVVEWGLTNVKVHAPGVNRIIRDLDRHYVVRASELKNSGM